MLTAWLSIPSSWLLALWLLTLSVLSEVSGVSCASVSNLDYADKLTVGPGEDLTLTLAREEGVSAVALCPTENEEDLANITIVTESARARAGRDSYGVVEGSPVGVE